MQLNKHIYTRLAFFAKKVVITLKATGGIAVHLPYYGTG